MHFPFRGVFLRLRDDRQAAGIETARTKAAGKRVINTPRMENYMTSILIFLGVIILWIVLNRWVLPRMGIQT